MWVPSRASWYKSLPSSMMTLVFRCNLIAAKSASAAARTIAARMMAAENVYCLIIGAAIICGNVVAINSGVR